MTPIAAELATWQQQIRRHVGNQPLDPADALQQQADQAELAAIRTRQAANRAVAYHRCRPARYNNATYEILRPDQDPSEMISRWWTEGPRALLIAGPARTGKTTAAYAITNHAAEQGAWVIARTAVSMSAGLKPSADEVLLPYVLNCDLLLLDDLGRERATDWWLEHLHRIVDERCSNGRRQIVTANTSADVQAAYDELVARYGDPIVERLIDDGGVLVFDGPAIRQMVTEW